LHRLFRQSPEVLDGAEGRRSLTRMSDRSIRERISDLVQEEHDLRDNLSARKISAAEEHVRLRELEIELDQCWDLLRQRQAKREFGEDPDTAQVRDARTVEGYQG
jgi:hypothetical protein